MVQSQGASITIGKLAKAGDVGVETIRYYQRRGLIGTPAKGTLGGSVRRYDAEDVRRLRFIRSAQASGFTLEQITELLQLDASHDRARARELARERIAALDRTIDRLMAAREALDRLAQDCDHAGGDRCPIIAAFEQQPSIIAS